MFGRTGDLEQLRRGLRHQPVVGLLGPRQIGKTTVARELAACAGGNVTYFDLESPADLRRLKDEATALSGLRGLVVIDEIQRRPDLFPILRVLADRPRRPAGFLVLGSASPHLLQQSSETLAGRITYHELDGFGFEDVGAKNWRKLWLRGGHPRSYLARNDGGSLEWRRDRGRKYIRPDLPRICPGFSPRTI